MLHFMKTLQLLRKSAGYRVLFAADGAEAVKIYSQRQHQIQLVIMDMMMPLMDGATALNALHSMHWLRRDCRSTESGPELSRDAA